ncbi:MAG: dTDP-glucose 4,6-dehydratase [Planctomycetaceae bacterium]|nr:dTDP-glucose 4,6-dehydratase [Planctomycetaceae bacterium]|tara:strand:- start:892 stop:1944 length:1053 start_codon:yes stop_codon:yes gene_type:complete
MSTSVLVTGGAGFIGSSLVRELIKTTKSPIVVLDKLTYAGNLDSLSDCLGDSRVSFIEGDIADKPLVANLLREHRIGRIFNLAAESHVDRSIDGPADFIETNVLGVFQLLEATLKYWRELDNKEQQTFRFLHISTDEVYGSLGETGVFTEASQYRPNSPYAASKASADHLVRAFHHTYGLPVLTTNCSNNYGPFQFPEKLIPLMIMKVINQQALPVYGDGSNIRDWLHVEDHCSALVTVMNLGGIGEVYNIGGNSECSNLDVVQAICDIVDNRIDRATSSRELITFVTDRPGHDQRYAIDCSKIRNTLGWQPQHNFESGIASTVDWYLNNSSWTNRVMDGSYRGQRLGKE